jgi:hypothetical protein
MGVLALLLTVTAPALAQTPADTTAADAPFALRDVPLETALQQVARRAGVNLAYPSDLVAGRRAFCRTSETGAEALLRCVLAGTGVDYVRSSGGTYVLFEQRRRASKRGQIAGTVVDAQTGEPLPHANVLLADASTGTTTDAGGRFRFGRVLTGVHRVVVTYVGYETQVDSVAVAAGEGQQIRVALSPQPVSTDPIVINGLQQRLPSGSLGRAAVEADPLQQITTQGTPSVLRRAGGEAGISVSRPVADLHVQGGSAGEHVLHLDGVPVRDPVSLGGFLGAFSPLAIDRITVHKAGFGAEHGSYTSGALSATHDVGRPGERLAVTVDPISANARADVQWDAGNGRTGGAMAAVRSSAWPVYQARSLDHLLDTWSRPDPTLTPLWLSSSTGPVSVGAQRRTTDAYFSDLHAAVRQPLGSFHELYVSAYNADNRIDTYLASELTGGEGRRLFEARDRYDWGNTLLQARYDWIVSSRLTGALQVHGSRHASTYEYALRDRAVAPFTSVQGTEPLAFGGRPAETNRVTEGGVRASADYSLAPRIHLDGSVEGRYVDGEFRLRNRFVGSIAHATGAWQWTGHLGAEVPLGLRTTLEGGTRLTYVPVRDRVYAEPRLSARFDRPDTPVGDLSARLAGGLYRQFVTQSEISSAEPTSVIPSLRFWLPLDASVAPPRAYHASGGLLLQPGAAWSVRLETYYKWHPRIHQVDYPQLTTYGRPPTETRPLEEQTEFLAAGEGRSYGASLSLRRTSDAGGRVTGGVTADWSTAERRYPGRFGDRWVAAPWEEPLRLTAHTGVDVAGGVEARARWESVWGRSWALRRIYYDYVGSSGDLPASLTGPDPVALDTPGDDTLAPFHRLDLGLQAERTWGGVTVGAELSVVNVLGRANAFDASVLSTSSSTTRQPRLLPGRRLVAVLSLRY